MNYRFNLDEWLPRFPLDPNAEHYSGQNITSPCDNTLMIGDMGCIFISIDEQQQLHWAESCF